ncbi:MAG: hypothetical protein PHI28_13815 [Mangrovibacterium sp.]|nr:hypothetical protein [Mangrovibacterium sp.]
MIRSLCSGLALIAGILLFSCKPVTRPEPAGFVEENIQFADSQYRRHIALTDEAGKVLNPRTVQDGKIRYIPPEDWTSGFFAGSLWYLYELTGDEYWKGKAILQTEVLDTVQYLTWHHDVGFMVGCSYGNGIRIGGVESWKPVVVQAARSLSTRFRSVPGLIQSWNTDRGWQAERGWECPVIIDNMMNLELLFHATKYSLCRLLFSGSFVKENCTCRTLITMPGLVLKGRPVVESHIVLS